MNAKTKKYLYAATPTTFTIYKNSFKKRIDFGCVEFREILKAIRNRTGNLIVIKQFENKYHGLDLEQVRDAISVVYEKALAELNRENTLITDARNNSIHKNCYWGEDS